MANTSGHDGSLSCRHGAFVNNAWQLRFGTTGLLDFDGAVRFMISAATSTFSSEPVANTSAPPRRHPSIYACLSALVAPIRLNSRSTSKSRRPKLITPVTSNVDGSSTTRTSFRGTVLSRTCKQCDERESLQTTKAGHYSLPGSDHRRWRMTTEAR